MKIFTLLLLLIIGQEVMSEEVNIVFVPLPSESIAQMDNQREYVSTLVSKYFQKQVITKSESDFELIQFIVNENILKPEQSWELQSLGVVLGDALAAEIDGLSWWQVTDEYGTDAVLRYKQTTLQIGAKTMISKRVENGSEVDVKHMYFLLKDFVETKSNEYR
ncbi:DUF3806 domain-containing protein [Saccharophagus degradans]|uniref:DUF3806 domain-containing protein n=1 Tax=Saccharophagus degradans TaxID=86304 RepID=UPI00247801B0|nr:DUF3806 domain-containing protein [Saccharophagus degradans]WGO96686.1 DUF3806 domain-containing protein [Saccharophagus degradans]WGO98139.1 DUF3806 domain-containing protein [Saccharophagus degradans]